MPLSMNIWIKTYLALLLASLVGCSSNDPETYVKTVNNILTDQYVGSGIYWVSNEHVVLQAVVRGIEKEGHYSIYQVDIRDDSFLKIIDISGKSPLSYQYCFDGDTFYVLVKNAEVKIVNRPSGYDIEIIELEDKKPSTSYRPLRCRSMERPTPNAGYNALRKGDGFIKYENGGEGIVDVYLSDDLGNNQKKIVTYQEKREYDFSSMFKAKEFLEKQNAYFGVSSPNNKNCFKLWWLYRDNWKVDNKTICLGKWAKYGSRLIHSLDDALLIEHYTKRSGAYLIHEGQLIQVEAGDTRGVSISPDGCKAAYGKGPMRLFIDKAGQRQKLKVFDLCEYKNRPEPSILGFSLVAGEESPDMKRKKNNKEPFYFAD